MANESDSGEKTEDPSQHRIDEFRNRGEVASSKELSSVLVLSASVLTLGLSMVYIFETMTEYVEWLYSLNLEMSFQEKHFKVIAEKTVRVGVLCTAPVFLSSLAIGILSNVAQVGLLFSPEVLQFKPERLNPIEGLKKLFTIKSIVEAVKGIFKFTFVLSIVFYFMKDKINSFSGFLHLDFVNSFLYSESLVLNLAFSIIVGLLVISLGDLAYQKFSYKKKLMMTKEEAKKEHKEQEGNPEIKQKIRAVQREMANKRMMDEVPNADVIITNPTHISIVLKYDKTTMISPEVVGKGADFLAMKIREKAKEHGVPIVENVPLARAMYKTVKVNEPVPRSLYKAVAEVLAFVYKLKKRMKALG